jgi:thiamine-monophosphate kinase
LNKIDLALSGGEEYELVFTLRPDSLDYAKSILKNSGCELQIIGEIVLENKIWLEIDDICQNIPAKGWDHFIK